MIELKNGSQPVNERNKSEFETTFTKQLQKGMDKYGVPLTTFNGRSAVKDAFEELVDLSAYLTQLGIERQALLEILAVLRFKFLMPDLPQAIEDELQQLCYNIPELSKKWNL